MGMQYRIVQVSERDLVDLRADPELVEQALTREGPERERPFNDQHEQLMLFGLPPAPLLRLAYAGSLYLEKRWDVLHYLITGHPGLVKTPLSRAIFGAGLIEECLGCLGGRAWFLTPRETSEVASGLSALTHEELRLRFIPERLDAMEVYPGGFEIWEIEYLLEEFDELLAYYRNAAECGNGMVMALM